MLVIGGTYSERCDLPPSEEVFGSGLRGAAVLAAVTPTRLVSYCDTELLENAKLIATTHGVRLDLRSRPQAIGFRWWTPFMAPTLFGTSFRTKPAFHLEINEPKTHVLVYGMLESDHSISAAGIVYDPQRPQGP